MPVSLCYVNRCKLTTYVDNSIGLATEQWSEKVGIQSFDASSVFDSIFKAPVVKSLSITLVRDVDEKAFVKALVDVITRRNQKPTDKEESSLSTFRNTVTFLDAVSNKASYLMHPG